MVVTVISGTKNVTQNFYPKMYLGDDVVINSKISLCSGKYIFIFDFTFQVMLPLDFPIFLYKLC